MVKANHALSNSALIVEGVLTYLTINKNVRTSQELGFSLITTSL